MQQLTLEPPPHDPVSTLITDNSNRHKSPAPPLQREGYKTTPINTIPSYFGHRPTTQVVLPLSLSPKLTDQLAYNRNHVTV